MASVGTFSITEDRKDGRPGESFEWTADRKARTSRGGARAIPRQPWTFGGGLRTIRTDYPGARTPSEQVLGPNHAPFTVQGRFDDRYNFEGYAVQEQRRFEEMCFRGNPVRIQFQNQSFTCLITEWSFPYKRAWEIHYQFTVSVHGRADDNALIDRSPATVLSPSQEFDALAVAAQALTSAQRSVPAAVLIPDVNNDMVVLLDSFVGKFNALGATIDGAVSPALNAVSTFKRMASQFRTVSGAASKVLNRLVEVRSDVEMTVRTATAVLDFEEWSRSLRFQSRLVIGKSDKSAQGMDDRASSKALAFYRPFKGESLYSVSRQFYGTPHSWRLIADANRLKVINLTGDEFLIIPERSEA